jgi:hypothetical protein
VGHVSLDHIVTKLAANEAFGIKDGVGWIAGTLVLGRVADETLGLSERDIGRGGPISLIVRDDLHTFILPDANAGVGGSKVDTDCTHSVCLLDNKLSLDVCFFSPNPHTCVKGQFLPKNIFAEKIFFSVRSGKKRKLFDGMVQRLRKKNETSFL